MSSIRLFCALLVCLLAAPAAHAATLGSATWLQVIEGVPMTRTTTQLGASGTSTTTSISVDLSYPQTTFSFFVPRVIPGPPPFSRPLHLHVTQGGPQHITATPGMASGTPGIPGTVVVMTARHAAMGVNQSRFIVGSNTLVAVPLDIGKTGAFTATFFELALTTAITVDFFAWTPGMVTFTGLTTKGVALPSVMAAGSFDLTFHGGGTVTLVSPSKVSVDGSLAQRRTASFTTLKLTFIPEPGTGLLLGAAAATLVLARRR